MLNPKEAASVAEQAIVDYVAEIGCDCNEDIANALEMLMSKSARAIEKVSDTQRAKLVCDRTSHQLSKSDVH